MKDKKMKNLDDIERGKLLKLGKRIGQDERTKIQDRRIKSI